MIEPRRIAVIGAGPKGLYCLERLAAELHRNRQLPPVEIHIYEPHPYPGAGPVYDPTQPDYLRMNFANGKIDMWPRNSDAVGDPKLSGPSFVQYLEACDATASDGDYAPRRVVGSYLSEGFNRVVASLRSVAAVQVHSEAVVSVERLGREFEVTTATRSRTCGDVLLATGHGSRTAPNFRGILPYPVNRPGGVCDVAPGATVALRGLGLTAIDVALALSEGRGGRFVPTAVPGSLRYQPSGIEPGAVLPFSRTGRPMAPKPHPILMPHTQAHEAACLKGARRIDEIAASGTGSVRSALVATSADVLRNVTGAAGCDALISEHLEDLLSRRPVGQDETVLEMKAAVETAFGQRSPGPDWALGIAWRGIYPALVRLVAARQLDHNWTSFSTLAVEMERVAFGPPAENAARLLALIEAGIVDTSCAANPTITEVDGTIFMRAGTSVRQADVLVNAVLDPAGAAPDPSPLLASLFDQGLARTTAHSPGLEVLEDGTCIDASGAPTIGLAAVGRPTEGSILGNDTLSRSLHDTPELWAKSTVARLHQPVKACVA